jgi:hypothetical protein
VSDAREALWEIRKVQSATKWNGKPPVGALTKQPPLLLALRQAKPQEKLVSSDEGRSHEAVFELRSRSLARRDDHAKVGEGRLRDKNGDLPALVKHVRPRPVNRVTASCLATARFGVRRH